MVSQSVLECVAAPCLEPALSCRCIKAVALAATSAASAMSASMSLAANKAGRYCKVWGCGALRGGSKTSEFVAWRGSPKMPSHHGCKLQVLAVTSVQDFVIPVYVTAAASGLLAVLVCSSLTGKRRAWICPIPSRNDCSHSHKS